MRVLIACDSFKGCLGAREACRAAAAGVMEISPDAEVIQCALADGGEGTLDVILKRVGGTIVNLDVAGPLGRPVKTTAGIIDDGVTAVIETARICGLTMLEPTPDTSLKATTAGVGEAISHFLDLGIRRFVICLGGTATTDGGAGMLMALGATMTDANGNVITDGGGGLEQLCRVDLDGLDRRLGDCDISILTDVDNPLTGPCGASAVFAPQKGAGPPETEILDRGLGRLASLLGVDPEVAGYGAAGGLAMALSTVIGGRIVPGIATIIDMLGIKELVAKADAVIFGEGRIDSQSLDGKALSGIARCCQDAGVPLYALGGAVDDNTAGVLKSRGIKTVTVTPEDMSHELAMRSDIAVANIAAAAASVTRMISTSVRDSRQA